VFVALVFLADRTAWRRYGLLLAAAPLFYGFGAAGELNVRLDASVTSHFGVPIVSRDYYFGRLSNFYLILAPWGDWTRPNKNYVSWPTYFALRNKSVACIAQGPGALGVPWTRISPCTTQPVN
jgi:hypothetical protein